MVPSPNRARWRGSRAAAVALLGAVWIGAPASAALTLTLAAPFAVWNEPLAFSVTGGGCAPTLSVATAPAGAFLDVTVHDACPAGQDPAPFELAGELRNFPPGSYTVRATDSFGGVATQPLELDFAADAALELPAVAGSDDPAPFRVAFFGAFCEGIVSEVNGTRIDLALESCPILPPPPQVVSQPVDVGPLAPGTYRIFLHDNAGFLPGLRSGTLRVRDAARCFPAEDRLCLQDGRFAVTGTWRTFDDLTGSAHATALAGNEQSGLLWFFSPDNAEITVKVLDGCGVNGAWWAFLSSASNVEYSITVSDTVTGHSKAYTNALGHVPSLTADVTLEACR